MIICPNCNHQNPEGAVQCEACYTPLPTMIHCPNCGAVVQSDASFCGQCGFELRMAAPSTPSMMPLVASELPPPPPPDIAPVLPEPLLSPLPVAMDLPLSSQSASAAPLAAPSEPLFPALDSPTQVQMARAGLLHLQTKTLLELPSTVPVIHIGKPNDRVPPDLDISGFPNSEIVSRIHADIRAEADVFYLEDMGSSNGTYVNNVPLLPGNRHRLRAGDRIALGKGDKVTFLFQVS